MTPTSRERTRPGHVERLATVDAAISETDRRLCELVERRVLPSSLRLRPLLRWLPLEQLDAIHVVVCGIDEPRRPDRERAIATELLEPEGLAEVLFTLAPAALVLLRWLLDRGGVERADAVTREHGDDSQDPFDWLDVEPPSPLGQLRFHGLAFVGRMRHGEDDGRTVVVPADLRDPLREVLAEIDDHDLDLEATADAVRKIAAGWCRAMLAARQADADPAVVAEAVDTMEEVATLMLRYQGQRPSEWTEASLLDCLTENVPRKVSADERWFDDLPGLVADCLEHAGSVGELARGARLAAAVRDSAGRIRRASRDPRRWGTAKQLVMAAQAEGVDLADPVQREAFIDRWSQHLRAADGPFGGPSEPARSVKVGRNEPCPCGSGKKFKRCCG